MNCPNLWSKVGDIMNEELAIQSEVATAETIVIDDVLVAFEQLYKYESANIALMLVIFFVLSINIGVTFACAFWKR